MDAGVLLKLNFKLDSSMMSVIYVAALVAFFLVLVILTITLIASRSKSEDEYEEDLDEDYDEEDEAEDYSRASEEDDEDETDEVDDSFEADAIEEADDEEAELAEETLDTEQEEWNDDEDVPADDIADDEAYESEELQDEDKANAAWDDKAGNRQFDHDSVTDALPEITEDMIEEFDAVKPALSKPETEDLETTDTDASDEPEADISNTTDTLNDLMTDSAFAVDTTSALTNEAINASVREAELLGAAVSQASKPPVFGAAEALDKGSKKRGGRSVNKSIVPSTDDFYWFNKIDVAEKPSYKTDDMYYHYFNIAKDCIKDLIIEMYDSALVRTEEIRYIAYGIEPREVSMADILSSGSLDYIKKKKKKDPVAQDYVKIYEKWCGYVDKLFDIVEIHADKFTVDEIRSMLYEYGRNDVDVLIEGL